MLTEEFVELPPDRLREVLAMEKLNVGNEKHVLEAVVRWFGHDAEDRRVGDASNSASTLVIEMIWSSC